MSGFDYVLIALAVLFVVWGLSMAASASRSESRRRAVVRGDTTRREIVYAVRQRTDDG